MQSRTAFSALLLALAGAVDAATVEAVVMNPNGQPVPDAVVVLEPLSPAPARPHAMATIEQRGREFLPHVTVVQVGTAIEFPNQDTTRHHVYSFSPARRFEIKLYAGKPGQPVVFDKPGEVIIGCNIHDWMEAHVLVVDTPYFAKTVAKGSAVISRVPAGRYRLRLWHPQQKMPQAPSEIDIGASTARLALALDVKPREPKPQHDNDTDRY
jgi:plastocyanin